MRSAGTGTGSSWSWRRTRRTRRDLVAAAPALSGELAARAGHVPVLRLPFAHLPDAGSPDAGSLDAVAAEIGAGGASGAAGPAAPILGGFATVVELPLRDADA